MSDWSCPKANTSSLINAPVSAKKAWLLSLALLDFQVSWMNHLSYFTSYGSAAPSALAVSSDIRSALHKMTCVHLVHWQTLKLTYLGPFLSYQLIFAFMGLPHLTQITNHPPQNHCPECNIWLQGCKFPQFSVHSVFVRSLGCCGTERELIPLFSWQSGCFRLH